MPLAIKPHSVTVAPVTQSAAENGLIGNPSAGAASAPIACLCVPMQPQETFQRFGVVLTDVWRVYLEVSDAASFAPQARIVFNGGTFWQQGDVEIHENNDPADCAIVTMTRNQYPVIT